jgi:hypothetical protein
MPIKKPKEEAKFIEDPLQDNSDAEETKEQSVLRKRARAPNPKTVQMGGSHSSLAIKRDEKVMMDSCEATKAIEDYMLQ